MTLSVCVVTLPTFALGVGAFVVGVCIFALGVGFAFAFDIAGLVFATAGVGYKRIFLILLPHKSI